MEQLFEWVKRTRPVRFFWTGMAISQLVTLVSGVIINLLVRGRLSGSSLLIGAAIAFVVSGVLGLITIAFVQRLKQAEQAHRQSEDRYRALVENIREVIYRVDQELVIRYLSPAVEALVGYPPEELIGKPMDSFIDEADRKAARALIGRALAGELVHGELRLRHRDGGLRWARASARQNRDGSEVGLQGVLADITEEKRAEEDNARLEAELQQAQRLEAVGTLAGGVAHDFNNLLAGILANSSLIQLDHSPGDEHWESLQNIEALVKQGAQLTRKLLGFARRGKYDVLPADLNRIATDTAQLFQRTKREIALRLELCESIGTVEVDRTQIEQVVLNLLVNAAAASPVDGTIWLRTANVELGAAAVPGEIAPGRYVSLLVADHGVGMDEATRQRVFEPFFTTRPDQGTGLGLASAYGIVRNHGGGMQVESKRGEGAIFTFYLPRSEKPLPAEGRAAAAGPPTASPARATTILLVDDEEYVARSTQRVLQRLGYSVLIAKNGREAIACYRERAAEIQLVILDMVMPEMGGAATFDALRALDPTVKVLLSSGYSVEGQAQEILARGCNGFIQKPYDIELLAAKLSKILGTR